MMQSGVTQIRWAAEVLTYMGDDSLASNHYTRPIGSTPTVGYKYNYELLLARNPLTLTLDISPQIAPFG